MMSFINAHKVARKREIAFTIKSYMENILEEQHQETSKLLRSKNDWEPHCERKHQLINELIEKVEGIQDKEGG